MPPELNGKCRELGYCDCGGVLGCVDPDGPGRHAPTAPFKAHRASLPMPTKIVQNRDGDVTREPLDLLAVRDTAGGEPVCEVCGLRKRSNHVCKGVPSPLRSPRERHEIEGTSAKMKPIHTCSRCNGAGHYRNNCPLLTQSAAPTAPPTIGDMPLADLAPTSHDDVIGPAENFDIRPDDELEPEPRPFPRPPKPQPMPETTRFMRQDSKVVIELPNLRITIEPTGS